MKKIFSLLLLLCTAGSIIAQDQSFSLQVRAGIQLPQVYGRDKDSLSYSHHTGLVAGLSGRSGISRSFALTHDVWAAIQQDQTSIELFPLSATWQFHQAALFAGPYASVLLRARNYGDGRQQSGYAAKNNMGFTVGGSYTLLKKINIEARYVRGLMPLAEDAGTAEQWRVYRGYWAVTLGYLFF